MINNTHIHTEYEEIKKYINAGEKEIKDNIEIFRALENNLHTCGECNNRYQTHLKLFKAIFGEDEFDDEFEEEDEEIYEPAPNKSWVDECLEKLRSFGKLIDAYVPSLLPELNMAGTRGITGTRGISSEEDEDSGDLTSKISIAPKQEEEYQFEFEVKKETTIDFVISMNIVEDREYCLYIFREGESEMTGEFPIEVVSSNREDADIKEMRAMAYDLEIGKYIGVVVEKNSEV